MNSKLYLFIAWFVCFLFAQDIVAMATSTAESSSTQPFPLLRLPADCIAHIGTFLDKDSLTSLKRSCRYCYIILNTNLFSMLSPKAIQKIIENCDQHDLISMWRTGKFFYKCFIPERPFVVSCENYFPYFTKKSSPTHKMIKHIGTIVAAQHHRHIPLKLDLSGQSLRPGIKASFLHRLFAHLAHLNATALIIELDLSRNFTVNFPVCLLHSSIHNEVRMRPEVFNEINAISWHLPNLVKLILNSNDLVEIPTGVASLTKLQVLCMAWNHLQPQSLSVCQQLSTLTELDLSRNCLQTIPHCLLQLPNLRVLNLSKNPIDEETMRRLLENKPAALTVRFD